MSHSLPNAVATAKTEPVTASERERHLVRHRGWLRRIDWALLPILASPLLILKLDDTWLFAYSASRKGFIDPWIYFGYFLDLKQHLQTFRSGYFGGRIPWILPGALAYHLFSPLTAAYVLHVAFYWVAAVSLYLVLKNTVGRRAALLSSLMMGCYSFFLIAIGWDYVDGAAISYMLLTLCMLTYAARAERPKGWLVAAGAVSATAIYCHLFLITFAPLLAFYYVFARREYGPGPAPSIRPFLHGVLAVTLVFVAINLALRSAPFFFIVPSLSAAGKLVGRGNPWLDANYLWITQATWLLLPAFTAIGALLFLHARGWRIPETGFRSFWQLYFLLTVLVMLAWHLEGQPVLQVVTYSSYFIPAMFLALGSIFAARLDRFKGWQFALMCCAAVAILLLPYLLPVRSGLISAIRGRSLLWPALLGMAGVVLLARQIRYTALLAVLLVCAGCAAVSATTSTRTWGHPGEPDDPAVRKQAFLAVVDNIRAGLQIDPTDHLFFWYDMQAKLGPLHRSVASAFIWSHRLVSENFPALGPKPPAPGTRVAILTVDNAALQEAEKSLQTAGLTARLIGRRRIREGPIGWDMVLIEIEKRPGTGGK